MEDMPKDLKKLLKLHDVKDSTIKLVHEHYSGIINEVAKKSVENGNKTNNEKRSTTNITELARESRIIK